MKNWFKKLSALAFALVMAMTLSLAAFAEGADVTFKSVQEGFDVASGSEYTETDLFDGLKNAMPGDRLTETVTIRNEARDSDHIRVYLRAVAHDDAANPPVYQGGETSATMQEFLSQLTMRVYNGTELIYESSPDQPDELENSVYLGDLANGETLELKVELDVPAELGNEYANRVGEVDWVFLAEGISYQELTVSKVWEDNGYPGRPGSVTVDLLRDGQVFDTVTLDAGSQWTHTWTQLDDRFQWSVQERAVDGYEARYATQGDTVVITNHMDYTPATARPDEHPDIAEGIANGTWGGAPTATPAAAGTVPQTSDALPLTALVVILVAAAAAIVLLVVLRRRKDGQDSRR